MTQKTTTEELRNRIIMHTAHRGNSNEVRLLWKGYLAGLMEWSLLSDKDYHELNGLLGDIAETERIEIFVGYPGQYQQP
jgi:hypothetical protein